MSKALSRNNKTFDDVKTMTFYDVILSVRVEKSRKSEFLCFSSNLLEMWYRGDF